MDPRCRRWLLWAALLLLASGLLFSGAAHVALHADDAHHDAGNACEACWLTSPEAPLGGGARGHVHVLCELQRERVREAPAIGAVLRADARGPPVG
ncbi:MAG: hypothetical protein EPO68_15160 [Planctomycetota bacterium]|nr:MAG: hypothetical protein EPO68_15160 [Planctomycetota bacterium]